MKEQKFTPLGNLVSEISEIDQFIIKLTCEESVRNEWKSKLFKAVKLLIERGINTEARDQFDHTALFNLMNQSEEFNLPLVKLLIKHSDINISSQTFLSLETTPFLTAFEKMKIEAFKECFVLNPDVSKKEFLKGVNQAKTFRQENSIEISEEKFELLMECLKEKFKYHTNIEKGKSKVSSEDEGISNENNYYETEFTGDDIEICSSTSDYIGEFTQ